MAIGPPLGAIPLLLWSELIISLGVIRFTLTGRVQRYSSARSPTIWVLSIKIISTRARICVRVPTCTRRWPDGVRAQLPVRLVYKLCPRRQHSAGAVRSGVGRCAVQDL